MVTTDTPVEFSVRLPAPMHRQLRALADRELSTLNREVLIAVRAHLDAAKRARKT